MAGRLAKEESASFAFFLHDPADIAVSEFDLSPDEIKLINPNTGTLPIFRTRRDAEITLGIYRRVPVLINENDPVNGNPWGVSFMRMFDMSNDSHLFHTREQLENDGWTLTGNVFERTLNGKTNKMLPLYEAKMIHQFDHRWATYDAGATRAPSLAEKKQADFEALPNYWVAESEMVKALATSKVPDSHTALGLRGITNSTNERTIISSLTTRVAAGNSCPRITVRNGSQELLSAILNSFALDFAARPKVGGSNLNFFIAYQLPVLTPESLKVQCYWDTERSVEQWLMHRVDELINTSWTLSEPSPPHEWSVERRAQLRAELDAAFFHLYGFRRDDADYAMDNFPIVKRNDETAFGEYRSKRLILEAYDAMQRAIDTGIPFESTLNPPPGHGPRHAVKEISA
ncbi:hypothetical protein [Arthrobacter sp. E3]|uniref:hypothetical protein n=1 Tax=Arthrobacter sp. E3 TaxID=517402 RepID=UPI001A94E8DA|nr:hypothetical protein [Arthrobacter sp. E3]